MFDSLGTDPEHAAPPGANLRYSATLLLRSAFRRVEYDNLVKPGLSCF
jgi:hypothetical protein